MNFPTSIPLVKQLGLAASCALVLTACGGGGGGGGAPTPTPGPTDTSVPVLTLLSTEPIELVARTVSQDDIDQYITSEGVVTVTDTDAEGNAIDLSASIQVVDTDGLDFNTPGSYTITYTVSDPSGNVAVPVTREVIILPPVDTSVPVLTLTSSEPVEVVAGTVSDTAQYMSIDGVVTVTDTDAEGEAIDLSDSIVVTDTDSLDLNKPGSYTITYSVSDPTGNAAESVEREILVRTPPPTEVLAKASNTGLVFTWQPAIGADHYRLLRMPEGATDYTQVEGYQALTGETASIEAAMLTDETFKANYQLQACALTSACTGDDETSCPTVMEEDCAAADSDWQFTVTGTITGLNAEDQTDAQGAPAAIIINNNDSTEQTHSINADGEITLDWTLSQTDSIGLKIYRQTDGQICDIEGSTATAQGDVIWAPELSLNTPNVNIICGTFNQLQRVSVSFDNQQLSQGATINLWSTTSALTYNARTLVFNSSSNNIIQEDQDGNTNIFTRDLVTLTNRQISERTSNFGAGISLDGQYVNYGVDHRISASGFVEFYRVDTSNNTEELTSLDPDGNPTSSTTFSQWTASGDGNTLFAIAALTGSQNQLIHRNLAANTSTLVTLPCSSFFETSINSSGNLAVISVAPCPADQTFFSGDTHTLGSQVALLDLETGDASFIFPERADKSSLPLALTAHISNDGNIVTFNARGDVAELNDENDSGDLYLYNRQADSFKILSLNPAGEPTGSVAAFESDANNNGRYVVFLSSAPDIVEGITNTKNSLIVRDTWLDTSAIADLNHLGQLSEEESDNIRISPDGRYIAFTNAGDDMVDNDTNTAIDIFMVPNPLFTYDTPDTAQAGTQ